MATNFINNLLSGLNSGKKASVYVSISPNIGLEMAQIDPATNTLIKYGFRPVEYNEALKEIKDYGEFKKALEDLFRELQIDPKSNIVLSIPTVHLGKIELPLILSDEMVNEAIISEVEQAYIFKKCEPIVSWKEVLGNQDSETRTMVYSAVQKPVVDIIKEIFTSIGATLDRLEISLTSDIRALSYTGLTNSIMKEGSLWTLMVIKSNGYELVQMNGSKIVDYYAEPLALKTYEIDEIYDAIYTSVQIALLNFKVNDIVIMSETDSVSAEHMASKMQIYGNIISVENNEFKKQDYMPVSLDILPDIASKVSLEAIGIAAIDIHEFQSSFEFAGKKTGSNTDIPPLHINWQGKEYEITEPILRYIVIGLGVALILPSLIAMLILTSTVKNIQTKLDDTNKKIQSLDSEISALDESATTSTMDINAEIERVIKLNRTKLIAYSSIGESIPKRLWLKFFETKEDGKIDIIGVSPDVEDIYVFYRNLKDSIIDSQLRLYRLEMQSTSVEDAISSSSNYEFEITNIPDEELSSSQKTEEDDGANNNTPPQKQSNNSNGRAVKDLEEVEVH